MRTDARKTNDYCSAIAIYSNGHMRRGPVYRERLMDASTARAAVLSGTTAYVAPETFDELNQQRNSADE